MCFFCPTSVRTRDILGVVQVVYVWVHLYVMFLVCKMCSDSPPPHSVIPLTMEDFQSLSLKEDPWEMENCFQGSLEFSVF